MIIRVVACSARVRGFFLLHHRLQSNCKDYELSTVNVMNNVALILSSAAMTAIQNILSRKSILLPHALRRPVVTNIPTARIDRPALFESDTSVLPVTLGWWRRTLHSSNHSITDVSVSDFEAIRTREIQPVHSSSCIQRMEPGVALLPVEAKIVRVK